MYPYLWPIYDMQSLDQSPTCPRVTKQTHWNVFARNLLGFSLTLAQGLSQSS